MENTRQIVCQKYVKNMSKQVYMRRKISEKEKSVSCWNWTGVISSRWSNPSWPDRQGYQPKVYRSILYTLILSTLFHMLLHSSTHFVQSQADTVFSGILFHMKTYFAILFISNSMKTSRIIEMMNSYRYKSDEIQRS
jgi:hypothetical protein